MSESTKSPRTKQTSESQSDREFNSLLPQLKATQEVVDILSTVWGRVRQSQSDEVTPIEIAQSLHAEMQNESGGWESGRVQDARAAVEAYLTNNPDGPVTLNTTVANQTPALLTQSTPPRFALTFGGQAVAYLEELRGLYQRSKRFRDIVDQYASRFDELREALPAADRGVYRQGFSLLEWINGKNVPPASYLESAFISQPLIFLTQVGNFIRLFEAGFDHDNLWDNVKILAGHSQGVMAAVLVSEHWKSLEFNERAVEYAVFLSFQGLRMQQAYPARELSPTLLAQLEDDVVPAPMAAISGIDLPLLQIAIAKTGLPITPSLNNTATRHVVSGQPEHLEALRRLMVITTKKAQERKAKGKFGGDIPVPSFEYLTVGAPYHCPEMEPASIALREDCKHLGFTIDAAKLQAPILSPHDASLLPTKGDLVPLLIDLQALMSVSWPKNADAIREHDANFIIDFGPGDVAARLTLSNVRGCGIECVPAADPRQYVELLRTDKPMAPRATDYREYLPRVRETANGPELVTKFTEFTKTPPVFMPGMTPCTVDAPIVAAAANGGYVSELAGGGQVTEAILRERLEELTELLEPGRGIVFNSLYLDPYLWKLQFGAGKLVQRLRDAGYPIIGVTVSAGIPPKEEAVALLREWNAHGIWLNALKPGNDRQIKETLDIADATPDLKLVVHIEGGKAGGHHSWEDLNPLLRKHYAALRARKNIIIAVGGGIGTEEQGATYLNGSWSTELGLPPMPVDAIFLGTRLMAAKEAMTSAVVKQALVDAKGTGDWVLDGESKGEVTSGRSQLDASIHYLDNHAARTGRLLDQVAGNAELVAEKRDEIIEHLNNTAKPYFGDLEQMTYAEVLERMVTLTKTGRNGRYEDGCWPDASYRVRFREWFQRIEQRLVEDKSGTFASLIQKNKDCDDPEALVTALTDKLPRIKTARLHPDDVAFFISLCRRPGKPVNFVPVVDASVRRWYKSDSLWQAHSDAYQADQVLIIPGPEAVIGITKTDEPVAEIMDAFSKAATKGIGPVARNKPRTEEVTLTSDAWLEKPEAWFDEIAATGEGPISFAFSERDAWLVRDGEFNRRAGLNPLRRLFAPRTGTHLVLDVLQSQLRRVRRYDASGRLTVEVVLDDQDVFSVVQFVKNAHQNEDTTLDFCLKPYQIDGRNVLGWDHNAFCHNQVPFYAWVLFGRDVSPVKAFDHCNLQSEVTASQIEAFRLASGDDTENSLNAVPLNMAFPLAWESIYSVISGTAPDMFNLVHEHHSVTAGEGWPLCAGDAIKVDTALTEVRYLPQGKRLVFCAKIFKGKELAAQVDGKFFIRGAVADSLTRDAVRCDRAWEVRCDDAAELKFLSSQSWLTFNKKFEPKVGDVFHIEAFQSEERDFKGFGAFSLKGTITREGAKVGTIEDTTPFIGDGEAISLQVLDSLNRAGEIQTLSTERHAGTKATYAPEAMEAFAEAGGDWNPLHVEDLTAWFGGFDEPIVHGMWTGSYALNRAVRLLAQNKLERAVRFDAAFTSPLMRGTPVEVRVYQTGMREGRRVARIEAFALSAEGETQVMTGTAEFSPSKTAYAFPGQGIQATNMGMETYRRSKIAKDVWDKADEICRRRCGFSLLRVVRENPTTLVVNDEVFTHPKGVLYLTRFTQVAMAVMAIAQVDELREGGAFVDDAYFCGHSVGEYAALAAIARALPLEGVIMIVYQRGVTMDRLVRRDEQGRSEFAMGVIRPHHAGLDVPGMHELVEKVKSETGKFLEIVNYNIKGKQYSVTGYVSALDRLSEELQTLGERRGAVKPPYVDVPGIDVPFHSTLLRDGVPAFRQVLDETLPEVIPTKLLINRYIPNLIAVPFEVTKDYVQKVIEASDSPVLQDVLKNWDKFTTDDVARMLMVELLAYQFASPVRWIMTQDILFDPENSVEAFVEIGSGAQPIVANMAKATLAGQRFRTVFPQVLNSEANFDEVFGPLEALEQDQIALPAAETEAVEPDTEASAEAAAPAEETVATPQPAAMPAAPASSSSSLTDQPFGADRALGVLMAQVAKIRLDQLNLDESLDELLGGNSARRNQVLADVGAEFSIGAVDGAHEIPLRDLASAVSAKAKNYNFPGKYLGTLLEQSISKSLGAARWGVGQVRDYVGSAWDLGDGHIDGVVATLLLETRDGDSGRGGPLSATNAKATNEGEAKAWIDDVVRAYGSSIGHSLSKPEAASGAGAAQVDAAALAEFEGKLFGRDGVLTRTATTLNSALGIEAEGPAYHADDTKIQDRLAVLEREFGEDFIDLVSPKFNANKHVGLKSQWAWSRRDLYAAAQSLWRGEEVSAEHLKSIGFRLDETGFKMAQALHTEAKNKSQTSIVKALETVMNTVQHDQSPRFIATFAPTAPSAQQTNDGVIYREITRSSEPDAKSFTDSALKIGCSLERCDSGKNVPDFKKWLKSLVGEGVTFQGKTAVVTGASPNSIAWCVVEALLQGGARVVATTSNLSGKRLAQYRALYTACAGHGAELHVVPFNQGSDVDVDAFIQWVTTEVRETAGGKEKVLKQAWMPDFLIPFAAMGDLGDLTTMGSRSVAAAKVLLHGVERLVGGFAKCFDEQAVQKRMNVMLPLSPNHGVFGGDGIYGETKAALETLFARWHSEQHAWGKSVSLLGARIGWVRGTGLMDANNLLAAKLEEQADLRTFSNQEMALLLMSLLTEASCALATTAPLRADFTGGFTKVEDFGGLTKKIREELAETQTITKKYQDLKSTYRSEEEASENRLRPLPFPRIAADAPSDSVLGELPELDHLDLTQVPVIVGYGEVSPWGSARTRWDYECDGRLSLEGAEELAWMTGRIVPNDDGNGWLRADNDEAIEPWEIKAEFEEELLEHSGIRLIDAELQGFSTDLMPSLVELHLDEDFTFPTPNKDVALQIQAGAPDLTDVRCIDGQWQVTRKRGSVVRMPRAMKLDRAIIGQVPSGWDPSRYGVSKELQQQVDRATLFLLISTAEAFASAGVSPEQLLSYLHPTRVANTQSSGIGGMEHLKQLNRFHYSGDERQNDSLQETLINVMAGYVVQSYVGSYGSMSFPVGACATAALSLADGVDKLMTGAADFVVTGGVDDYGEAGAVGFADMGATASSSAVMAAGIEPRRASRPNDGRRQGFVESQGAGTILITSAQVACDLGLPVYGIVAYAASFGDGINRSVPAPGLGILGAATEMRNEDVDASSACDFAARREQIQAVVSQRDTLAKSIGKEAADAVVTQARRALGHQFASGRDDISQLRAALAVYGLTADDIGLVSKHDTSTQANDLNENRLHTELQRGLHRTQNLPMAVISQKSLTGHPKGAAAAWQINGVLQAMQDGWIPPNQSLDDVDHVMRDFGELVFTDRPIQLPPERLRAGLVTSLGFGHVGAIACLLTPSLFWRMMSADARAEYAAKQEQRVAAATAGLQQAMFGTKPMFAQRTFRRFEAKDGTKCQEREEIQALLNGSSRIGDNGTFGTQA